MDNIETVLQNETKALARLIGQIVTSALEARDTIVKIQDVADEHGDRLADEIYPYLEELTEILGRTDGHVDESDGHNMVDALDNLMITVLGPDWDAN